MDIMIDNKGKALLPVAFLVLSNSTMTGTPINNLNQAFSKFQARIHSNEFLRENAEFSLITVTDKCEVAAEWTSGSEVNFPFISAEGACSIEEGLWCAIDLLETKIEDDFRKHGSSPLPTLIVISDDFSIEDTNIVSRLRGLMADDYLKVVTLDLDYEFENKSHYITSPDEVYLLKEGNNFDFEDFFKIVEYTLTGRKSKSLQAEFWGAPLTVKKKSEV